MKSRSVALSSKLTLAAILAIGASSAHAALLYWDAAPATNVWGTAANWSTTSGADLPNPAAAPTTADTAIFNNSSSQLTISSAVTASNITFDVGAAAYILGTGVADSQTYITASPSTHQMALGVLNDQTYNAKLQLGGSGATSIYTITNASTTNKFIFNGSVVGGSGGTAQTKTLAVSGAGNVDFNGAVNRGGAASLTLTKDGAGVVKFNNANSRVGLLTLNGGSIDLAADLKLNDNLTTGAGMNGAGGTITTSGGKILLGGGATGGNGMDWTCSAGGTITINPVIADGGTFNNIDFYNATTAGKIILKGANTYSGGTGLYVTEVQIGVNSVGSVGAITSGAFGTGPVSFQAGSNLSSDSTTARTILNALTFASNAILGDATRNGKLTFSATADLGTAVRTITANSDVQFDGILSGAGGGITLNSSTGFGKLTLTNTSNSFTGNVTLNANSGTLRITSSGALGTGTKTVTNTGASNLVPVTGANLLELDSQGGADIVLGSNISFSTSGAAGVILNTAGNNTINGSFAMTTGNGNTKIISNGGTLKLAGNIAAGAASRVLDLSGSSTGNNEFSGVLSNPSTPALLKSGAGKWILSGANTFQGTTSISGGTLVLTNNLALQTSVLNTDFTGGGALDLTGVNTPTIGGFSGTVNRVLPVNVTSLTLNPQSGIVTYSGSLSGGTGLALIKSGAGTQVLSNSNNYTGSTSITGGILQVAHNNALGTTSGVTMTANNTLQLANGVTVSGRTITITGYGANVRGALEAAAGATAEWAGPVQLGSGDSRVGAMGNGILTLSGVISDGTGTNLTISGQDAASVTPGKVIVSGTSNNYTGVTQIVRGILAIGANNALPIGSVLNVHSASSVVDAAAFDLNNFNQQVAGLTRGNVSGPAIVTNSGGAIKTLTINNTSNYTYDSAITGNVELVKSAAGNQTLSGTSTFTGGTRIDAGILTLANATDTLADAGAINVNGGTLAIGTSSDTVGAVTLTTGAITGSTGVLTGSSFAVESGTVSAKLGGAAVTLTKTTGGTVTLSADNSYTGATTVSAGTLLVNGSTDAASAVTVNGGTLGGTGTVNGAITLSGSAAIAPGASIGTLNATAGVTLVAGNSFVAEINTDTVTADKLAVTGTLALGGATLSLSNVGAAVPSPGDKFTIASYTTLSGTFNGLADGATVTLGGNNFILDYNDDITPNTITLTADTLGTPYDLWAEDKGLTVGVNDGKGDDPDNDGRLNIEEFAFDGDPLNGTGDGKIVGKVASVGGDAVLTLSLPVRDGAVFTGLTELVSGDTDGFIYTIQGSDDLAAWTLDVDEVTGGDAATIQSGLPALNTGWTYRTFRTPDVISADVTDFMRATVHEAP